MRLPLPSLLLASLALPFAASSAHAQSITLPPGFCVEQHASGNPLYHVSGLAARQDGTLFETDVFGQVSSIDSSGVATGIYFGGNPIGGGWSDCILGDGSPILGTDLVGAAFSNTASGGCCEARIYRIDESSGALTEIAGPSSSVPLFQHPSGLALSSGGAFGSYLYVGTTDSFWSPYTPTVHRLDTATGVMSLFATIPAGSRPMSDMAFDTLGTFGGDLFVADLVHLNPTATIWRIDATGAVTPFLQDQALNQGVSIAFGPGGNAFGTDMYVLGTGGATAKIWRIDPSGSYTVFADGLPKGAPVAGWQSSEGELTFSPDGKVLYAGITGAIWEISVGANVQTYCSAKVDSMGCVPAISFSGVCPGTSASTPFLVSASNLRNQKPGLLVYGSQASSKPFAGGLKCVAPVRRTPLQSSGGSVGVQDCSGSFSVDMNVLIQAGASPLLKPGATVYTQYWYRDPQSPGFFGLSNAGQFDVLP